MKKPAKKTAKKAPAKAAKKAAKKPARKPAKAAATKETPKPRAVAPAAPAPAPAQEKPAPAPKKVTKSQIVHNMLVSPTGATRKELSEASGWPHVNLRTAAERARMTLVEKDGRFRLEATPAPAAAAA